METTKTIIIQGHNEKNGENTAPVPMIGKHFYGFIMPDRRNKFRGQSDKSKKLMNEKIMKK